MEKFTADTDPFEEDDVPGWLRKQREDAARAETLARSREPLRYQEGERVGNFVFVRYMKYKNRAVFACPVCGKKFQYNVYTIRQKKRCRWYKGHKNL